MSSDTQAIIFCNCAHSQIIPPDTKSQVLAALKDSNVQFTTVPDLCGFAANPAPILEQWAHASELKIVACFPRAIKWLLNASGTPLPEDKVEVFNMRTEAPEDIISSLLDNTATTVPATDIDLPQQGDWVPWFPVIDYDRCNNCKQCMNFCLFGVYGVSPQGRIQVRQPANCKTNCPACARICPTDAIIFPKHESAPINGAPPDPSADSQKSTLDVEELIKSDVYQLLRQRGAGQEGNALTPQDIQKALQERQACCGDIAEDLSDAAASACGCECDCECDCVCAAAPATDETRACPCDCACHNDSQEKDQLE